MIKKFEGTGANINEARAAALQGLNPPETADVIFEVLQSPDRGILGLFKRRAIVVAYYEVPDKPAKKKPSSKKAQSKKSEKKVQDKKPQEKKAPAKKDAPKPKEETKPASTEEKLTDKDVDLDYACSYLKTMIEGFKVNDAKITAKVNDGIVEMNIDCSQDDQGIIIGRRGETLDSLQYLTSLAIKNSTSKYVRVSINVGDYKAKREETLKSLANKQANYVLRSGRRHTFEPMNPYERRIIHTAIQQIDGVESRSIGNGMDRRVVLEPTGGVKPQQRRSRSQSVPADREKKSDHADMPKFGRIVAPAPAQTEE